MKTKISVISCLLVSLIMVLPMSALADGDGTMRLNAWVSPDEYETPDKAKIYAVYVVTYPPDYDQDYCYVIVAIAKVGSSPAWYYDGYYIVGSGGGGDVDVGCNSDDGEAQFEWDYDNAVPETFDGYYYALVYAEAWEGWTQPTSIVYDETETNEFYVDTGGS